MAATSFTKDPDAVLDYKFDWAALTNGTGPSDWLAANETITGAVMTVPDGITLVSSSVTDSGRSVTAWLSGGTDRQDYAVGCKITTTSGRTDERSILVKVRER